MFRRVKLARVVPEPTPAVVPTQAGQVSIEDKLRLMREAEDRITAAQIGHRAGGNGIHSMLAYNEAKKYIKGSNGSDITHAQRVGAPMASAALGRVAKLQAMYKKGQLEAHRRFGIAA